MERMRYEHLNLSGRQRGQTKLSAAEGVLYAEKDFNLPEHPEIPGIPNLQVRLSYFACDCAGINDQAWASLQHVTCSAALKMQAFASSHACSQVSMCAALHS